MDYFKVNSRSGDYWKPTLLRHLLAVDVHRFVVTLSDDAQLREGHSLVILRMTTAMLL